MSRATIGITFFAGFALSDLNTGALINRLHAFRGVGALLGPVLATWIIGMSSWTTVRRDNLDQLRRRA